MNSNKILEQKDLAFSGNIVPLSIAIFCAEPRHKRIFTSIGAKSWYLVFLLSFKKKIEIIELRYKLEIQIPADIGIWIFYWHLFNGCQIVIF